MATSNSLIELRLKATYFKLWIKSDPDWFRRVDNPLVWQIVPLIAFIWGMTLFALLFSRPIQLEFFALFFSFSGLMIYFYKRGKRILPKLNQNFAKAKASHPAWKKEVNALEARLLKNHLQNNLSEVPFKNKSSSTNKRRL